MPVVTKVLSVRPCGLRKNVPQKRIRSSRTDNSVPDSASCKNHLPAALCLFDSQFAGNIGKGFVAFFAASMLLGGAPPAADAARPAAKEAPSYDAIIRSRGLELPAIDSDFSPSEVSFDCVLKIEPCVCV